MGLTLESGQALGVLGEAVGKYLDRHITPQLGVGRAIDLAHSARTEEGGYLVRANLETVFQGHVLPSLAASRGPRKKAEPALPLSFANFLMTSDFHCI